MSRHSDPVGARDFLLLNTNQENQQQQLNLQQQHLQKMQENMAAQVKQQLEQVKQQYLQMQEQMKAEMEQELAAKERRMQYQLARAGVDPRARPSATTIQKNVRRLLEMSAYRARIAEQHAAAIKMQAAARRLLKLLQYRDARRSAIDVQAAVRCMLARYAYAKVRLGAIKLQAAARRRQVTRAYTKVRLGAIKLQAAARSREAARAHRSKLKVCTQLAARRPHPPPSPIQRARALSPAR